MATMSEAFGKLFGRDVTVKPRGDSYRIELDVGSLDDASELFNRLDGRASRPR
jgi:hypothetical protein